MRIAVVAPPWFPIPPTGYGGVELVVALETEALVARGHEVTLFASGGSLTTARLVSPLPDPPPVAALGDISRGHLAYEISHAVDAYSYHRGFDVIHDHSGLVGPAIGAMIDTPVVHTLHGPWTHETSILYGRIHERVHLVAISERQRLDNPYVRYAGVVHNGVDLDAYPFRADKDPYLAYIGRSNPEKVPARAIELARRAGLPLKMIVKKNEEQEITFWNEEIAPLLGDDIEVLEQVPHEVKTDVLAGATALVFPIRWPEPFGLVMVEAMACGTPVITCPAGAAPEVTLDGVTGVVRAGDDDLVIGIQRAMAGEFDPVECRRWVEQHFSAAAMTRGYERIFEAVVGDGAASAASRSEGPVSESSGSTIPRPG